MLRTYPVLSDEAIARQGETWWFCDVSTCDEAVEIGDVVPPGWVTTDPEDRPTEGAAQFCPAHRSRATSLIVRADGPPVAVPEPMAQK